MERFTYGLILALAAVLGGVFGEFLYRRDSVCSQVDQEEIDACRDVVDVDRHCLGGKIL